MAQNTLNEPKKTIQNCVLILYNGVKASICNF